jgi:cytochrome c oxidase subunit 4
MSHSDHHSEGPALGHVLPIKMLVGVLVALLLLTGLTVWTGQMNFHGWDLKIAMVIAGIKATLVCTIFMHLKWDRPLNAIFFLISIVFVAVFLAFTVLDTYENEVNVEALIESKR